MANSIAHDTLAHARRPDEVGGLQLGVSPPESRLSWWLRALIRRPQPPLATALEAGATTGRQGLQSCTMSTTKVS